jgi:hypothetical protein
MVERGELSARVPAAAWQLGLAGLLPFGALALGVLMGVDGARAGLLNYGALILSFMGGCRWGFAAAGLGEGPSVQMLGISVLPALYAWVAILFPFKAASVALAVGFVALYVADRALTRAGGAPVWWTTLRAPLTIGAAASLAVPAVLL